MDGNPFFSSWLSHPSFGLVYSIIHGPHLLFSYLRWRSHALRLTLFRKTNVSASIARLSPCYVCRSFEPLQYELAAFGLHVRTCSIVSVPKLSISQQVHTILFRSFAFLLLKVLKVSCKDYNHYAEVCPLSCKVMLQPLSAPLQNGIRFLRNLLPAFRSAFLTVGLLALLQEKYRLTMFHIND